MTKQGGLIHLREFCQICRTFGLRGNLPIIVKDRPTTGAPVKPGRRSKREFVQSDLKGSPREGGCNADCSDSGVVLGFGAVLNLEGAFFRV
jgi:hypothetical protein